MDEYRFRPDSELLGCTRLSPPMPGAELLDVSLGVGATAVCTWLVDADIDLVAPSLDSGDGHLRPPGQPVTVTQQSADGETINCWSIAGPLDRASYRVLPGSRLLAVGVGQAHREDPRQNAVIYDRNCAMISMGSFGAAVTDVRTTPNGSIWVAHDLDAEGAHGREGHGLERFSSDLKLQGRPDDDVGFDPGSLSVLGDDVVFYDHHHDAPYSSRTNSWLSDPPDALGRILHDPAQARWGFVRITDCEELEVTLGWSGYQGEWKPFSKGSIALPFASPLEQTRVDCDASSVHVWVGQRWYSLSVWDLFDDSIRVVPATLPESSCARSGTSR